MAIRLIYSNHIEPLADRFIQELKEEGDMFNPPMVIVPNPYLKKWLQMNAAMKNGISANINFLFPDQGAWKILSLFDTVDNKEKKRMMSSAELSFYIYESLAGSEIKTRALKPFTDFLYDGDKKKPDFEKRAWQLSEKLSKNFLVYEQSREGMVKTWTKGAGLWG